MTDTNALGPWECFQDASYYDMWCVRRVHDRTFGQGFHLVQGEEAAGLRDLLNTRTTNEHPNAEDYRNRAERDAMLAEAMQIIGQIELDHRYPPAPDSMERRIERARDWLARAALEGNDANNTGEEQ